MPFFRYQAFDASGKSLEGTLQANSPTEAAQALSRQGLRVTNVTDARQAVAAPVASVPAGPRPVERAAPVAHLRINTVKNFDLGPPRRTKRGSEKKLMLIFHQLGSYFKAGLNPQRAFLDLSQRASVGEYRESLKLIADRTTEGGRMSDIMELYPYLYPPHVVGIVRAGETGAFLPEAMDSIAAQIEASYKMKRWALILGLTTLGTIFLLIVIQLFLRATVGTWDAQEQAGGMAPGVGTFLSQVGKELLWPVGPLFLLTLVICSLALWYWTSMPFRPLRHRMVLVTPTIGKRAKKESLGIFSWVLSMLSKGGASPSESWTLASASMPNLEMRRRMEVANVVPGDTRKLSTLLHTSRNLPIEFAQVVETGEMTGDVPGALMHVSRTAQDEFKSQDQASKVRLGCWIFLVMGIGFAIGFAMFYGGFMSTMIHKITD